MDKKFLLGAGVVVGAMMLVPGLAGAVTRAGRPIARAAVKTGAVAWTEFRKAGAETFEHMEDLAAEFRAEVVRHATDEAKTAPAEGPEPPDPAAATTSDAKARSHA
jgi:hypothetical protein